MDHVDAGGNCDFIETVSVDSIQKKIEELKYTSRYYTMQEIAMSDATDAFLYSRISKKSLECMRGDEEG